MSRLGKCKLHMLLVPVFGVPASRAGRGCMKGGKNGSSGMPGLPVPDSPALWPGQVTFSLEPQSHSYRIARWLICWLTGVLCERMNS